MTLPVIEFRVMLDLFPLAAAVLAAVACGVIGNFLVLRKLSLMGDAISHSVLPGLVVAFMITSTRSPVVMLFGGAAAGVATVVLVELIKRFGRVEPGAAMGVVFSVLFALGVLLIETSSIQHIDLDADCVLHGQLEALVWYGGPSDISDVWSVSTLQAFPRQVSFLLATVVGVVLFVAFFFKELRISAFDSELSDSQGISAKAMHYALMVVVAATTVASFEAVGSILVIAMLICPAATARLVTDRLGTQVMWSVVFAFLCAVVGYFASTSVPGMFGRESVKAAGTITVCAGLLLSVVLVMSPRYGMLFRAIRRWRLSRQIALDDVLAVLYRAREANQAAMTVVELKRLLAGRPIDAAVMRGRRQGVMLRDVDGVRLTARGVERAGEVVGRHRLWESYLVDKAGLSADHVHGTAEQLEHVPTRPPDNVLFDPHGRPIPRGTSYKQR